MITIEIGPLLFLVLVVLCSDVTNVPDGWRQVAHPVGALFLPAAEIREGGRLAAERALHDLLYLAWPEADRAKFDPRFDGPRLSSHHKGVTD